MPRGARRKTYWRGRSFDYLPITTGKQSIEIVSNANLHLVSEEPTVIRMVGRLLFQFERAGGGFEQSMRSACWAGITCMHEELTSQSAKDDLAGEFWMWASYLTTQATFTEFPDRQFDSNTVISGGTLSRGSQHVPVDFEGVDFDIRAMRKAPEPCNIELNLHVEEQMPTTGADHFISGLIRVLLKE